VAANLCYGEMRDGAVREVREWKGKGGLPEEGENVRETFDEMSRNVVCYVACVSLWGEVKQGK